MKLWTYSRGGNSGNHHMYHLFLHMLSPPVSTKISFIYCIYPKINATLFVIFFNDLLEIIVSILFLPHFPFLSFTATASPLPLTQSHRIYAYDLETLRCCAIMPQDQQRSKNRVLTFVVRR